MIEYYGTTKKQRGKRDNGDYLFLGHRVFCEGEMYGVTSEPLMAVICDGGNHNVIVTKAIANSFTSGELKYGGTTAVQAYLRRTNQELYRDAKADPHIMTAIAIGGQIAVGDGRVDFNLGHVRTFGYRNGRLQQLSKNELYVQNEDGFWASSKEPALGASMDCLPHVDVQTGYAYSLICSDGFYRFVDGDDVEAIMNSSFAIQDKGRALVELALEGGSDDDLSLIILCTRAD